MWYKDIIYVLQNLQAPIGMDKNRARFIKLKVVKYCISNGCLYWKDLGGILLNCLLEDEAKKISKEFYEGDCGGHHYWKTTINKILRVGYYWPTLFIDVYKKVRACIQCHKFADKQYLLSLPLNSIIAEAPF